MFGQHVAGIIRCEDFVKSEISLSNAILHPKVGSRQESNFPKSSTSGNANRRSGIRHNAQLQWNAQVLRNGLQSQALGSALGYPCKFGRGRSMRGSSSHRITLLDNTPGDITTTAATVNTGDETRRADTTPTTKELGHVINKEVDLNDFEC